MSDEPEQPSVEAAEPQNSVEPESESKPIAPAANDQDPDRSRPASAGPLHQSGPWPQVEPPSFAGRRATARPASATPAAKGFVGADVDSHLRRAIREAASDAPPRSDSERKVRPQTAMPTRSPDKEDSVFSQRAAHNKVGSVGSSVSDGRWMSPQLRSRTRSRKKIIRNGNPGPGEYEAKTSFAEQKGFSWGSDKRDRYYVQKVRELGCSPGPQYNIAHVTGFREQALSRNRNGPQHSFGGRPESLKPSSEEVVGPGHYNPKVGSTLSHKVRAPAFGFGSAPQRVDHSAKNEVFISTEHARYRKGTFTPGPGAYECHDDSKRPVVTWHRDLSPSKYAGKFRNTFISHPKFYDENPGPGSYEQKETFFQQFLSKKTSAPCHSFGTAQQRARVNHGLAKVPFISEAHTRELIGIHSPGPLAYNPTNLTRTAAKFDSGPRHGFGTADRFKDN